MSTSSDDPTVLIVDPLPLRNLGLVGIVNRLFEGTKCRVALVMPDDLDKWIQANRKCSVIVYNVGGSSVADHRHLKQIRMLRMRMTDVPLVIFSDNNSRKEVRYAMKVGARGFLYAGTEIDLARQALSLVRDGSSNFSVAAQEGRSISARCSTIMDDNQGKGIESRTTAIGVENLQIAQSANNDLTQRQKALLEGLRRGESNEAIARRLGIGEGTIKSISAFCSTIMGDNHGKNVGSRTTVVGVKKLPIAQPANNGLTQRQKAVLERLSHGDSNKAIARRLGIGTGSKVHVRQIMRKLGLANRTQVNT